MGIFGKSGDGNTFSKETTVISKQARIKGEFELDSNLHIDGEVEGRIECSMSVSVGKSGKFRGEIKATKVMVSGVVFGTIDCEVAEILSGGRVIGDVAAAKFIIQDCGIFDGVCKHKESEVEIEQKRQLELKEP